MKNSLDLTKNRERLLLKILPLLVAALLVCIPALSLSLADSDEGASKFSVYFYVDGEQYDNLNTNGKKVISIPENPVKTGYTFGGWFFDSGTWSRPLTASSFLNERLTANVNVYAKWQPHFTYQTIGNIITITGLTYHGKTLGSLEIPLFIGDFEVKHIADSAFYDCDKFKSIIIPDSVTSIGSYAFDSCSSLINITIPDSVKSIGYSAFNGCSSLENVTIEGCIESIENGTLTVAQALQI